ncbi:MAG: hypothetical protein MUO24_02345 [Desulfobacterales bacterium]|nr:hypothetical protein [Desulfobacterales bacterium]
MRNISHEILREWFRRWYRYATEIRKNPLASAVPYRLKHLAICQDALEEVMRREGIGQTEIEGLRAEVEARPAPDIIHPHQIPVGQSEQDREFRDAILADQTKCQRGDWGK